MRLFAGLAVSSLAAAGAGMAGLGAAGAGFLGLGAGFAAGGLLAYAMSRAARRPGTGRAVGVSFAPRAALLLAAFLWARAVWPGDAAWILPGYLAGEAVWVARALRHLKGGTPSGRPDQPARAEE